MSKRNYATRHTEMWHLGYNGPRVVEFVESFPWPHGNATLDENKNKSVVLFNGVPEVVDERDLFDTGSECYFAAAGMVFERAGKEMANAMEYQQHAQTHRECEMVQAEEAKLAKENER